MQRGRKGDARDEGRLDQSVIFFGPNDLKSRNGDHERQIQRQWEVVCLQVRTLYVVLQVIFVPRLFAGEVGLIFVQVVTDGDHGEEQRDQDHQCEK